MTSDLEYAPEAVRDHPMMRPIRGQPRHSAALLKAWEEATGWQPLLFTYYPTVEAR